MKRRLKINGVIIFLAVSLIALFPSFFFRKASEGLADEFMELFGVAFILLGQIFRVSARGYKSEHSGNGSALIQTGPYALVRNPMYLGILLIGLGIVMMLFNLGVLVVFLSIFVIRYLLLIFKEEKKLKALFPRDYPDYQKRTPRLLPSLKMLLEKDISEYLPLRFSWVKKELGSILAVLLITIFVESWEDIKNQGVRVYLRETIAMFITIILFIILVIYLSGRTQELSKNDSDKSADTA
jgi:protein-S-isoprenylcysteine O-methyltransferase Ste14